MRKNVLFFMLLGIFSGISSLTSCNKDDLEQTPYDPEQPIGLESYSPKEGGVGTQLIIRGENFGYDASKVKVWLDNDEDRAARVISARGNRIYAVIPARAGTGKVTVSIDDGGGNSQTVQFEDEFQYEFQSNLSTLCGGAREEDVDGAFNVAQFVRPYRLALDDENQQLFVLECDNSKCLRIVDLANETVSTPWRAPGLHNLRTLCFGINTDTLFVGVEGGSANLSTVYLLRTDGFVRHKTYAQQSGSNASTVNPVDGELFINNYYDGYIYHYNRETHTMEPQVRAFNTNTDFTYCWSADGSDLFALSVNVSTIVKMDYNFETKQLSEPIAWVGNGTNGYSDGIGLEALINLPFQMCNGGENEYFLADTYNHCIRRIVENPEAGTATVTTYAGVGGQEGYTEGVPTEALLRYPVGVAAAKDGSTVYVADKDNNRIVKITVE